MTILIAHLEFSEQHMQRNGSKRVRHPLTAPSHARVLTKKQQLEHEFHKLLLELFLFLENVFLFVSIADLFEHLLETKGN